MPSNRVRKRSVFLYPSPLYQNVTQSLNVSRRISSDIAEVNNDVGEITISSEDVKQNAIEMDQMHNKLNDLFMKFILESDTSA